MYYISFEIFFIKKTLNLIVHPLKTNLIMMTLLLITYKFPRNAQFIIDINWQGMALYMFCGVYSFNGLYALM